MCGKKNFSLPRLFMDLVSELSPYVSPDPFSTNSRALSADKKVATTLYYLKDTGSLGMTANTFVIALCTASAVIISICKAISKYLGPRYFFQEIKLKCKIKFLSLKVNLE